MADNSTLVLFGARGNLSRIKLIPGLFHLDESGKLSEKMKIVSVGRQNISQNEWENEIKDMLEKKFNKKYDLKVFDRFIKRNIYHSTLPDDPDAFKKFSKLLLNDSRFPKNFAFFLSVRPSDFAKIVDQLAEENLLNEDKYWRRVLIEKPFGTNLKSAINLQASISKHLKETQIYRIDHYLGKSALQNILWTRFSNSIFEHMWNNEHIDHIQITNHETLGVGERTEFYDATGALRDMTQSHLLQMLALTTMEKPKSFSPDDIRVEKIKLLKSIRPIPINKIHKYAFRAQYKSGNIEKEGHVKGYLEELENDKSVVETYAAIKIFLDTPRWKNIPIYLRTAKRLNQSGTFISIKFKNNQDNKKLADNWLVFSIQPKESTYFEIQTKVPGLNKVDLRSTKLEGMNRLEQDDKIDAYETLMLDLIEGNQSRFLHIDEVKAAWSLIDPIIENWTNNKEKIHQYTAGTLDPKESEIIFENQSQFWREGN
ncbi:glucose-6-phosphate dehydrogenase [Methylophilaceae bacterium]|jgi:glucose-6-phosphate 1-dehydrogenase|nr:glucose-6-phosphate dehydrogenase [Methylophilaceae bacterium]